MYKSSPELRSSLYLAEDTIHSVVTGPGGSIQVIRVSGPQVLPIIYSLCNFSREKKIEARKAYFAEFFLQKGVKQKAIKVDEGVFVFFKGPNSFTGEDVVEFSLHGSRVVVQEVLNELNSLGSRQSLPGEFSFRSVRNGKMSVTQAQAVADLISAQNERAVSLALEKMGGTQNRLVQKLSTDLIDLATYGELGIDFSDQDVEDLQLSRLKEKARKILELIKILISTYDRGIRIQDGIKAAFIGLPNAGKSSLFNELLGEDRSIVSDIPGTTRDIVGEILTLKSKSRSVTFRLSDTAGIRTVLDLGDKIERVGIERSEKAILSSDIIFLVAAADSEITELEALIVRLKFLCTSNVQTEIDKEVHKGLKILPIITKSDLGSKNIIKIEQLLQHHFGLTLTTTIYNPSAIQSLIENIILNTIELVERAPEEIVITNREQKLALVSTIDDLERSIQSPSLDLFAADIRQALFHLEPLIGQSLADDILTRIFSQFCIGK